VDEIELVCTCENKIVVKDPWDFPNAICNKCGTKFRLGFDEYSFIDEDGNPDEGYYFYLGETL